MSRISIIFTLLLGFKSQAQIIKANSILWEIRKSDSSQVSYVLGTIHMFDTSEYKLPMDTFKKLISRCGNLCVEVNTFDFNTEILIQRLSKANKSERNAKESLNKKQYGSLVNILKGLGFNRSQIKHLSTEINIGILCNIIAIKSFTENTTMKFCYPDFELTLYANTLNHTKIHSLDRNYDIIKVFGILNDYSHTKSALINIIDSFNNPKKHTAINLIMNQYINQSFDPDSFFISKNLLEDTLKHYLLEQRNINFANRIDSLYSLDKKLFVAIGIGHLFGNTGVLNLLEQKGYAIKPYKIDFIKK